MGNYFGAFENAVGKNNQVGQQLEQLVEDVVHNLVEEEHDQFVSAAAEEEENYDLVSEKELVGEEVVVVHFDLQNVEGEGCY